MSRLTALPCDLAELVLVVVVITVINQGISRVSVLTLLVLVLYLELVAELVLVGAGSVDSSRVVASPVELVLQHATSVLDQIISHATVRLKQ